MIEQARIGLLRALRASWDELVDRICHAVVEQIPTYDEIGRDELRASIDRLARLFAAAIAGQALTDEALGAVRVLGRQRARAGFDLQPTIDAVGLAVNIGIDHLSELAAAVAVHDTDESVKLAQLVLVPMAVAHAAVLNALASGFHEGQALDDTDAAPTVRFVEQVLFAATDDWAGLADEAAGVGHGSGADAWGVVLVFDPSGGPLGEVRTVVLRVSEIDGVLEGPPSQRPALHYPLLVHAKSADAWQAQVERVGAAVEGSAAAWIASEQPGRLEDCPAQYTRVSRNIEFARLFPSAGRRVDPGVLQLCRTLASAPELERAELFRDALGGLLLHPKRDDVFPVLDARLVAGSQAAAAALLSYDESTVYRYLQIVKKVTGRAWHDHLDQFVISAALVCRWLAAQTAEDYAAHRYGPLPNFRVLQGRRP